MKTAMMLGFIAGLLYSPDGVDGTGAPPPVSDKDIIEAQVAELGSLNRSVADLNVRANHHDASSYRKELDDLNAAAIALNKALGRPMSESPLPSDLPPVPTLEQANAPKTEAKS